MLKITIPTPCHEDWNKMNPTETGRHCSSCAKTVVDFTHMSDYEVQHYFLHKKDESVCGRFKVTQVQQIIIELPNNIFSINMPLWKKFLAACLIIFSGTLFSCETKVKDNAMTVETAQIDSQKNNESYTVGGLAVLYDSVPPPHENHQTTVGFSVPVIITDTGYENIMGDIALEPEPPMLIEIAPVNDTLLIADTTRIGEPVVMKPSSTGVKQDTLRNTQQAKNPPKADSTDCNIIKYNY